MLIQQRIAERRAIEAQSARLSTRPTTRTMLTPQQLAMIQERRQQLAASRPASRPLTRSEDEMRAAAEQRALQEAIAAAQKLQANPANTFVIEDSVHGIAGAKQAGMRVIGFTGAAHSYPGHADVLTEAGAETVIRRWADFPGGGTLVMEGAAHGP